MTNIMRKLKIHTYRLLPLCCMAALATACTEQQPIDPITGAIPMEDEPEAGDPRSLTSDAVASGESGAASLTAGLLQENEEMLGLVSSFFEAASLTNLGERPALEFGDDGTTVTVVPDDTETMDEDESIEEYTVADLLDDDVDDVVGDGGGDVDGNASTQFTVFIPSNAAFELLSSGVFTPIFPAPNEADEVIEPSDDSGEPLDGLDNGVFETASEIFRAHVIVGQALTSDMLSDGGSFETLSGDTLDVVTTDDGEILIDGYARVIRPDITSNTVEREDGSQTITFNNGVVHVIDAVLFPEGVLDFLTTTVTVEEESDGPDGLIVTTLVETTAIDEPVYPISIADALLAATAEEDSSAAFSVFQSLANSVVAVSDRGFGGPLRRLQPPEDDEGEGEGEGDDTEEEVVMTTVFAPTNGAFDAVADSIEIPSQAAADVLTFHTLDGAVLSTDLAEGEVPTNLGPGTPITVTSDGTVMPPFVLSPTVSGTPAQLLAVDIEFVDGVVHIIDQVLSPPAGN